MITRIRPFIVAALLVLGIVRCRDGAGQGGMSPIAGTLSDGIRTTAENGVMAAARHRCSDMRDEQPALFAAAVGGVLRELRTRRGWTRHDLSTRTGGSVSPSAISGYESGYRALKLELLALLCAALDVRVETVVTTADQRVRNGNGHLFRPRSRRHASL